MSTPAKRSLWLDGDTNERTTPSIRQLESHPTTSSSAISDIDKAATSVSTAADGQQEEPNAGDDAEAKDDDAFEPEDSWQGWAELENDPTIFNVLLRDWGVKGVQVREVVPLDAIFDSSPESTYGLVFLSRYAPPESIAQPDPDCRNLWFANQVSTYSCASVALMNIVNNHESINLGSELTEFKASTISLSPKHRGLALDGFAHVRDVHNSFATSLDRMFVDLKLKSDVLASKQSKAAQKRRKGQKRKRRPQNTTEEEDNTFHFVAYVPARGHVWKLDGLDRHPQSLGAIDEGGWLAMVVPELQQKWEGLAEGQIEFSLLSLVAKSGDLDSTETTEENEKAERLKEDWGPLVAGMVRFGAEKGTLHEILGLWA